MKKRILAMIMALFLGASGMVVCDTQAFAEGMGEDIDFSFLDTDTALIGYAESQTWGLYLSDGHSIINKISFNQIGAGGITNAARKCKVSTTSIVERKTSSGWGFVTSWTQTNENAFSAVVSKSLYVATNNYYRVRSYHYAASDSSSSGTGALPM